MTRKQLHHDCCSNILLDMSECDTAQTVDNTMSTNQKLNDLQPERQSQCFLG